MYLKIIYVILAILCYVLIGVFERNDIEFKY
jgi:hypothetical protein